MQIICKNCGQKQRRGQTFNTDNGRCCPSPNIQNMPKDDGGQIDLRVNPALAGKPPLGVMPHIIWLEKRITELSRALYEYFTNGYYDDNTYKWLMELYNVYTQRDRYIEEQQKVKGCSA